MDIVKYNLLTARLYDYASTMSRKTQHLMSRYDLTVDDNK